MRQIPRSRYQLTEARARVQYELTQHPRLLEQLPGTLLELLQTALESSRYALSLKQDNADVLLYVHFFSYFPKTGAVTHEAGFLLHFSRCVVIEYQPNNLAFLQSI